MDTEQHPEQHPATEHDERRPYEPPQLRMVELLPEETLGIGCKTQADVPCGSAFNFGS